MAFSKARRTYPVVCTLQLCEAHSAIDEELATGLTTLEILQHLPTSETVNNKFPLFMKA